MPYSVLTRKMIKHQGSVLVSTLVTMGILSILFAVSIPFFRQYQPNLQLTGTARELTTDLRYAQQLTISEQVAHYVEFNTSLDTYLIIKGGTATTTVKTVALPAEVGFQSVVGFTDDRVRFNSYGAVTESGDITLVNTNGQTKIISVKPSGYVQLAQ